LRSILQGVVDVGTATQAKMKDITSGGKTGTAQKVVNGMYSHSAFMSSFIGFAPVENPRLAIIVMVDEPRGSIFGGSVAAPAFQEVAENALRYLQLSGDSK
jgi:cell division protein FtsI/penicillin-binding protein 2